ncbi:MAG: 5-dehydro-2-deoxygluconokinase [Pseudorhodoplanes sp.]
MAAAAERRFDLIAMGRAAVDLYGEQIGGRLEDMTSFAKYLGGSAANTAVGAARLGLRVAMLTRVGDEHMGRFLRETLAAEGVDVSHVRTDPHRLTGLVVLGIKDSATFPLIFFRENCADMAIEKEDFDAGFIGSSKALLVNGTHFSQREIDAVCRHAMALAKQRDTKIVFDIDYRPVLWGLTSPGLGEERFVASDRVSAHLQSIVPHCDLVIGTEEEIHIAGGTTDTRAALCNLRGLTAATIVLKRGARGCVVYSGAIPADLESGVVHPGFPTEVFNVLGAGDGFAAGFLFGWLRDASALDCGKFGNACGSLVVSRHGCAPAMPSRSELDAFLERSESITRPHDEPRIVHLHRTTTGRTSWPRIFSLAFDHRRQFADLSKSGDGDVRIGAFKRLIGRALLDMKPGHSGAIVDDRYGFEALTQLTGTGRWLARPVEVAGSRPLAFETGHALHAALRTWPAEHAIKCLVSYSAKDADALRAAQENSLTILQDAVFGTGHRWLLEVIPPEFETDDGAVPAALEQLYQAGLRPDWWKLPPLTDDRVWYGISTIIRRRDPQCGGAIVLGYDRPYEELFASFASAQRSGIGVGFAVGRSVWGREAVRWFAGEIDDRSAAEQIRNNYQSVLDGWMRSEVRSAAPGL